MGAKASKSRYPRDSSYIPTRKRGRSSRLSVLLTTTPHGSATYSPHSPHLPHHMPLADSIQLPLEEDKPRKENKSSIFAQGSRRFGWCLWDHDDMPKPSQSSKKRYWRRTTPSGFQRGWEFVLGVSINSNRSQAERDAYLRIANWVTDVIEAGAIGASAGNVGVEAINVSAKSSLELEDKSASDVDSNSSGVCNDQQHYCLNGGQGFDVVDHVPMNWPTATEQQSATCLDITKDVATPLEFVTATIPPSSPPASVSLSLHLSSASPETVDASGVPTEPLPLPLPSASPNTRSQSLSKDMFDSSLLAANDANNPQLNLNSKKSTPESKPVVWEGPLPPARHTRRSISGVSGVDKHRNCKSWAASSDRAQNPQQLANSLMAWQLATNNGATIKEAQGSSSAPPTASLVYDHDRSDPLLAMADPFNQPRELADYNDPSLLSVTTDPTSSSIYHTDTIYGRRRAASMSVATGMRLPEIAAYSMSGMSYSPQHLYYHHQHYFDQRMPLLLPEDKIVESTAATQTSTPTTSTVAATLFEQQEQGTYLSTSLRSPNALSGRRKSMASSHHRYSAITLAEEEEEEEEKEEKDTEVKDDPVTTIKSALPLLVTPSSSTTSTAPAIGASKHRGRSLSLSPDGNNHRLLAQSIFDASTFGLSSVIASHDEADEDSVSDDMETRSLSANIVLG
ncbi:hypothetical protein BDF22DRAFT_700977 [Syncephalis plumigaleata]|nr:hypothetical protein BDF22DRAFT_700977 [Syncephalis plumigaleata]